MTTREPSLLNEKITTTKLTMMDISGRGIAGPVGTQGEAPRVLHEKRLPEL
jgi:hypothetical protein